MRGSPELLTGDLGENCSKALPPSLFAEHPQLFELHAGFQLHAGDLPYFEDVTRLNNRVYSRLELTSDSARRACVWSVRTGKSYPIG